MKKILTGLLLLLCISTGPALAVEYSFIIPNPPGSSSDLVARAVADEYNRLTGNTLVFEYAPGADHLIAVSKFKNQTRLSILLGTTTIHCFNHVYKDTIPYSDSDFDHVGWIGWTPNVWYVRNDSSLKTLEDINLRLRSQQIINIGVDGLSTEVNVISLKKQHPSGSAAEIIKYKGSPQALNDILGGHLDVAIASISGAIVSNTEEGKIRILATTNNNSIRVNSANVPAAQSILGVNQFNGGFLLSVSPVYNTESQRLKDDLLQVINSPTVREKLSKINIEVSIRDANGAKLLIQEYREKLKKLK